MRKICISLGNIPPHSPLHSSLRIQFSTNPSPHSTRCEHQTAIPLGGGYALIIIVLNSSKNRRKQHVNGRCSSIKNTKKSRNLGYTIRYDGLSRGLCVCFADCRRLQQLHLAIITLRQINRPRLSSRAEVPSARGNAFRRLGWC